MKNTAFCDDCESTQNLSEDGYCLQCGKHYDNMPAGKSRNLLEDVEYNDFPDIHEDDMDRF